MGDYVSPGGGPGGEAACVPNATIPNASLFEQVHVGTGYDSDDPSVQNDTMMNQDAALLANRTDCEFNSALNFDALLLGGYFCHRCLPDLCESRGGGQCMNLQWSGFTCDNEVRITIDSEGQFNVDPPAPAFEYGRTYRFAISTPGSPVRLQREGVDVSEAIDGGPLIVNMTARSPDALVGPQGQILAITVTGVPQKRCARISKSLARQIRAVPCHAEAIPRVSMV